MILLAVLLVAGCFAFGLVVSLLVVVCACSRSSPSGGTRVRQRGYYRRGRWVRSHTKRLR